MSRCLTLACNWSAHLFETRQASHTSTPENAQNHVEGEWHIHAASPLPDLSSKISSRTSSRISLSSASPVERLSESAKSICQTDGQDTTAANCPASFTLGRDHGGSSSLTERCEMKEAENSLAHEATERNKHEKGSKTSKISSQFSAKGVLHDVQMTQVHERANVLKVGDRVLAEENQQWYEITSRGLEGDLSLKIPRTHARTHARRHARARGLARQVGALENVRSMSLARKSDARALMRCNCTQVRRHNSISVRRDGH